MRPVIHCIVVLLLLAAAVPCAAQSTPQAIWLVDNFEDGYLWDTWTQTAGSTCNPFIVVPTSWSCAEGTGCLEVFGDCGDFYDGVWTDLAGFQATSFGLYVRADSTNTANAYVVLDDDTSTADGTTVFFFGNPQGRWLVSAGAVVRSSMRLSGTLQISSFLFVLMASFLPVGSSRSLHPFGVAFEASQPLFVRRS